MEMGVAEKGNRVALLEKERFSLCFPGNDPCFPKRDLEIENSPRRLLKLLA